MLEKKTYKILKCLYRQKRITYEGLGKMTGTDEEKGQSQYVSCLFVHHFVSNWKSDEIYIVGGIKDHKNLGLEITLEGSAYIERKRKDAFMFWVPYTITTLVAIASLLVAVAGLLRADQTFGSQDTECPYHIQEQTDARDVSGR